MELSKNLYISFFIMFKFLDFFFFYKIYASRAQVVFWKKNEKHFLYKKFYSYTEFESFFQSLNYCGGKLK